MKEKLVFLDNMKNSYKEKIEYLKRDSELKSINDQEALRYSEQLDCNYITIMCKNYPNSLKILAKPPLVLYYLGNIKILNTKQIAIIGSRYHTSYGGEFTKNICKQISGYTITSGYAYGIDQLAHTNAMLNGLKTIAVLGGGFDNIYPNNNSKLLNKIQQEHLLLSEYPPTAKPKPWNFLMRNRIIASLSDKILVIEATEKSGSLKTVEVGLEQNKEIYALPGSVFSKNSSGTNLLIEEGANLLTLSTKFNNL